MMIIRAVYRYIRLFLEVYVSYEKSIELVHHSKRSMSMYTFGICSRIVSHLEYKREIRKQRKDRRRRRKKEEEKQGFIFLFYCFV